MEITLPKEERDEIISVIKEINKPYSNKNEQIVYKEDIGPVSVYWIEFEGENGDHMVNYAMKIGTEKAVGYRTLSQLARLLDRNLGIRGFVFYHFQGIVLSIIGIILAIGLCFALGFDYKEANALVPVLTAIIGYLAGKTLPDVKPGSI